MNREVLEGQVLSVLFSFHLIAFDFPPHLFPILSLPLLLSSAVRLLTVEVPYSLP